LEHRYIKHSSSVRELDLRSRARVGFVAQGTGCTVRCECFGPPSREAFITSLVVGWIAVAEGWASSARDIRGSTRPWSRPCSASGRITWSMTGASQASRLLASNKETRVRIPAAAPYYAQRHTKMPETRFQFQLPAALEPHTRESAKKDLSASRNILRGFD
jgi:hypothetical protein